MDLFKKYHGEEAVKYMLELKGDFTMAQLKESIECDELLRYYRRFIRMSSELSKDVLSSYDSISLITFIDLMMKMGYFSHDKKFNYNEGTEDILFSKMGVRVITGSAVCRQISGFATDMFKSSNKFCENFYCLRTNRSQKQTLGGHGNHVANVIEYNGSHYVYDITNQAFFTFRNPIELVSSDKSSFLYYKPQMQLATEKVTLEDIEQRLREYKKSSEGSKITLKELNAIQSQAVSDITARRRLLKDFEDETRDIKKKIFALSKRKKS